jgi:peptidoglycan hydrolase CwlO-like protein
MCAEYDVANMESLNAHVLELNDQLTDTQRELAREKRRLQQAMLEIEADRNLLEARVAERDHRAFH